MSLEATRRTFAEELRRAAGVQLESLVDAFASVPRERFLGPGPWQVAQPFDPQAAYRWTPDARPDHLYQDVVVAIDPARQLNNGQPSAHARWIDAAAPRAGESVLHVGCGTGYYTAILAELCGESGRVVAIEIDPELARRATDNLAAWPQARVYLGDGSEPHGPHDVIYVNAGTTHPRKEWLSSLSEGGRMILPLTVHLPKLTHGVGFLVCVERRGARWPARVVSSVGIYDCVGARDEKVEPQLRKLLGADPAGKIHAASVEPHAQGDRCLVHTDGFCLQG